MQNMQNFKFFTEKVLMSMSCIKVAEGDYTNNYITGSCHEEQVLAGELEGNCWRVSRLTASRQKLGFSRQKGGNSRQISAGFSAKGHIFSRPKGPVSHNWSFLRETISVLFLQHVFALKGLGHEVELKYFEKK
jgi:hypothetical protein